MKVTQIYRKIIFSTLSVYLLIFFFEYPAYANQKVREYWPTNGWKTSRPESQGMDSANLLKAVEFIQNRLPDAYSLLVVKNGYLVFEKYFRRGNADRSAVVHSVTKSVTSALIGIALQKGYIKSTDQKLVDFFPEHFTAESDPRKKEICLKHLLTMSAGFQWDDWGSALFGWAYSPDRLKYSIQLPLRDTPGEVFEYNTSASHLLSGILTKTTHMTTLDFANQHLFKPLGISINPWQWRRDKQGYYIGGYGLELTARDMAKIGYLYLNNGYWNGRSIVSETWVKESTRQHIYAFYAYGSFGYGYQWWVNQVDGCSSFRAWGRRGQFIVVVPELDLVMVVTSKTAQPHPPTSVHYSPLFDIVASAVTKKRSPAKTLVPIKLPPDVNAFLTDFNQAWFEKDFAKISDFISDSFLSNGRTKDLILDFFGTHISYLWESKMILTEFEPQGGIASIKGVRKDKYFRIPLPPGSMLIKENGRWKLYGNQIPK